MPVVEDLIDVSIPRDPNARHVSVAFGYDPITDAYYPLTIADNGDGTFKLVVDATFGGSISVGNVSIKDPVGSQMAKVTSAGKMEVTIDDNALNQTNMTIDYTYDVNDRVATMKEYPTGAGAGTPAKLTTFTYKVGSPGDGKVLKMVVSDTTV
jgi:hypothetical protein